MYAGCAILRLYMVIESRMALWKSARTGGRRMHKPSEFVDRKLLSYMAVGLFCAFLGVCIMFGLYNFTNCGYWIATIANYALTGVISYYMNSYFTFKMKKHSPKRFMRFWINIAVCYTMAYGFAKPIIMFLVRHASKTIQDNIAMVAGMVLFAIFNYIGQRLYIFR